MKSYSIYILAACLHASAPAIAKSVKVNYVVTNPGDKVRMDEPVVIPVQASWVKSATVFAGGKEVPSQMDDLDRNGTAEELAFVVDLQPREQMEVRVVYSDKVAPAGRYPARVHAQMFLKDKNGKNIPKETISSEADTMYNWLQHHGPAFESELIAYRLYFDKKQTVDLYGKRDKGLELSETMWYPTDGQLAAGSGDDILRVFGSVGVGTLRGWDNVRQEASFITPVAKREARILARGPVRTVVEMKVDGWKYRNRDISMDSRYILWAGHRDVQVQNFLSGDLRNLYFATGVMKMDEHTSMVDDRGLLAVWGTDYPVDDTVKYAKQTVGMALSIAPEYIKERSDDKANYLYQLVPDGRNRIDYRITAASAKETFGYKSADRFFGDVKEWADEVSRPVTVAVGQIKTVEAADGITRIRSFVAGDLPKQMSR